MNEHDMRYVTLIGTPLAQSYAARMHNAAYAAMGAALHYTYCEAGTEHLGEIVAGLRHIPCIAGFAVTKPNKVKVLEYLDAADTLCGRIGACNTVVKTPDGALIGYNTDAEERGCTVMNGLEMSLWQGARQIELWTGRQAPIAAMREALREK